MQDDCIVTGEGPPLVLLHGWPFHNQSFRKLLPLLAPHFTCYAPNSMGMSATGYTATTDFSFQGHAQRLLDFADSQSLGSFAVLAHDTGGTIARLAAVQAPDRISKLALLSTEIPGHRPPFIPLFQKSSYLPGNRAVFTKLLNQQRFLRSPMGFGGSFVDKKHIDEEFVGLFATHWTTSKTRFKGLMRYLQGIDFTVVDDLTNLHQRLRTPTQFIWGAQDITFPTDQAQAMSKAMPSCVGFDLIAQSAFLAHEEQPEAVAASALKFLT